MAYLIDSDWLIDHLDDDPAAVALLTQLAPQRIAISIISYLEVFQGTLKTPAPAVAQAKLETFLRKVPVFPLSPDVARRCAHVRETLRRQGKQVHRRSLDLIIAATALEHDLTLVTRNKNDFADVVGLQLY
ncbi:MAG: type II toxin-antitoxin system VapC family toxin [Chloroflexota bacterium]|nr:type II toxin-antitoxin system VapC family toxin [Chloroflexota bacterium]